MGGGGAGGTGGGTCQLDPDCAPNGKGSLCVNKVCTAPTEGEACKRTTVVVVDPAFTGSLEGAPLDACYFRTLGEGMTAVAPGTTTRLAVYADAAQSATPIQLAAGVVLEGHPSQVGQLTALSAGVGGPALVSLGEGSGLKGFRLDGKGGKAVLALSGEITLSGPLELRNGSPALSVEGTAKATVTGTMTAPVLFTDNARGIVVGATAGLEMTGEGGASLVLEKTSNGAAILVEKGDTGTLDVVVSKVTLQENRKSSSDGTGAIEIRPGRKTTIQSCTFVANQQSITLNGLETPSINVFADVTVVGNDFSKALPSETEGIAICGSSLGADNTLVELSAGLENQFPSGAKSPGDCQSLETNQKPNCFSGGDIGHDNIGEDLDLGCP
jgi:hypothetical protein